MSEEKHGPVKIFNYLQKNGASNYDHDSVVKKIQELLENGVIDQSYKIINLAIEVLNLPPDDVEICSEISDSNDFDSQLSQFNSSNRTPIENVATTPILNTAANPKHHFDDMETHIKLVEDKLLSKNSSIKIAFSQRYF